MVYSRPFVKVRIQGVFGTTAASPVENWSTGFNISSLGGGSFDPANLLTFLTAAAVPINTFHVSSNIKSGSQTWLTKLTAAYIGTDGLYVLGSLQPTTVYTYVTPAAGTGSPIHPLATCCVLSLRSLRLRGPASHGRMYYPTLGNATSGTDMTMTPTATLNIANSAKTMIDGVNGFASSFFGSGSKIALVSKVGGGAEAIVTSILVDQKFDHMESRERSILGVYSQANAATYSQAVAERDEQLRQGYHDLEQENEGN